MNELTTPKRDAGSLRVEINERCAARVRGFLPEPSSVPGRLHPACVTFEIGASCGAMGTYGVHLSPQQARMLATALIMEAEVAEGRDGGSLIAAIDQAHRGGAA